MIKPGSGNEEILLAADSDLQVTGYYAGTLE